MPGTAANFVSPLIRLNPTAKVAVARGATDLADFPEIDGLHSATRVARGHKMAVRAIPCGEDMDIDCGTVVNGDETIEALGERLFQLMLDTASGAPTSSEELGYGDNEFVPWQVGAIM